MKIGLVTDGVGHQSFDDMLSWCQKTGVQEIELACGTWSDAPHLDLDRWLEDKTFREENVKKIKDHGLSISALNCSGNPLFPFKKGEEDREVVKKTFQLSHELELDTVVMMSGLPGGGPRDEYPNWSITSWPPVTHEIVAYQWEVAIEYWQKAVEQAKEQGVKKIALEPHGFQLVHNVENFRKLRAHTDQTIGFNLDPSHLFWMGADPLLVASELKEAIYHVHVKDVRLEKESAAKNTLLDTKHVLEVADRSWNFAIPGYGHTEEFWRNFVIQLKLAGYDGVLSIEHEDYTMETELGIKKTVNLLKDIVV
ncbi:sugar phosphate isomerase/epimerase family protein [Oceanobacillus locisalsi]|uniref:Sugar phosphate isomerase/epimerase family protein n=1 Tax=Oceanobacillus locisalsi TaxID=546107 RepID=A0ABW3NEN9_9BACI